MEHIRNEVIDLQGKNLSRVPVADIQKQFATAVAADVSHNRITEITNAVFPRDLLTMTISHNPITKIDLDVDRLPLLIANKNNDFLTLKLQKPLADQFARCQAALDDDIFDAYTTYLDDNIAMQEEDGVDNVDYENASSGAFSDVTSLTRQNFNNSDVCKKLVKTLHPSV